MPSRSCIWGSVYITKQLIAKIKHLNPNHFSTTEGVETAEKIKKELCYVAQDFDAEMSRDNTTPVPSFVPLMAGKSGATLGSELFSAPESYFQPALIGKEAEGVHHKTFTSIMHCDIDMRKDLFSNIILAGKGSQYPGIVDRLTKEMHPLVPDDMDVKVAIADTSAHSVWKGGSILAVMPSMESNFISPSDFETTGPSIVHRKCI